MDSFGAVGIFEPPWGFFVIFVEMLRPFSTPVFRRALAKNYDNKIIFLGWFGRWKNLCSPSGYWKFLTFALSFVDGGKKQLIKIVGGEIEWKRALNILI